MRFTVYERDVWVRQDVPPRMVRHVMQGRVFYSNGGNTVRNCLISTFRAWARYGELVRREKDARG